MPGKKATTSKRAPAGSPSAVSPGGLDLARVFVLAAAGLVPIAASYYPGFSATALPLTYDQYAIVKYAITIACAGLGLAAWLAYAVSGKAQLRRAGRLEWLGGGFLCWAAAATALSIHRPTALLGVYERFEGMVAFLAYVVLGFLALQTLAEPRRLRQFAIALVASGCVVAAYGLLQSFGVLRAPEGTLLFEAGRAFSTYGNPDMLGMFLLVPFCLSLSLALETPSVGQRAGWWFAFVVCAVALLLTFTRASWLAAVAALVLLGVAARRRAVRLQAVDAAFLALTVLGLVVVGVRSLTSGTGATNVAERLITLFDTASGSVASRLLIWSGTAAAIGARPVFGYGPDTLLLVWTERAPASAMKVLSEGQVDSAHSLPLHLAAGIGVVGALLYLAVPVGALVVSAKAAFARRDDSAPFLVAGIWVALTSVILASLVSVTDAGLGVLIWMLAGALASQSARTSDISWEKGRVPGWAAAVVSCVASVWLAVVLTSADHAMAKARIEAGSADGIAWAERAAERNPWFEEYRIELALQHFDTFVALAESGQSKSALEAFERSEAVLLELGAANPRYRSTHLALADLYLAAGRIVDPAYNAKAEGAASDALKVAPGSPQAHAVMVRALLAQGRVSEAALVLEEGLRYAPGDAGLLALEAEMAGIGEQP